MALAFAKALHVLGIQERSVVLIQGNNSPEHLASIAGAVLSDCIYTDIYPTNSPALSMYQAKFTKAKVLVCDTYKRLKEKYLDHADFMRDSGITCAILFREGLAPESAKYTYTNENIKIFTWSQALQLG